MAPSAIAAFLDDRGIGHCAEDVAARACYLFCRLVKSLRSSLRPLAPSILQSLQPHLVRIATRPLMDLPSGASSSASAGGGGGGGSAQRDGSGGKPANAAIVDDRLYVFEAVGLLLGQDEIPVEQQAVLLGSLLQPLKEQIEGNLMVAVAATQGGGGTLAAAAAAPGLILQALEVGGGRRRGNKKGRQEKEWCI